MVLVEDRIIPFFNFHHHARLHVRVLHSSLFSRTILPFLLILMVVVMSQFAATTSIFCVAVIVIIKILRVAIAISSSCLPNAFAILGCEITHTARASTFRGWEREDIGHNELVISHSRKNLTKQLIAPHISLTIE